MIRLKSHRCSSKVASFGDFVWLNQPYLLDKDRAGIVRWIGETEFKPGIEWYGFELFKGEGKNNGTVEGTTYFNCEMGKGVFVKRSAIQGRVLDENLLTLGGIRKNRSEGNVLNKTRRRSRLGRRKTFGLRNFNWSAFPARHSVHKISTEKSEATSISLSGVTLDRSRTTPNLFAVTNCRRERRASVKTDREPRKSRRSRSHTLQRSERGVCLQLDKVRSLSPANPLSDMTEESEAMQENCVSLKSQTADLVQQLKLATVKSTSSNLIPSDLADGLELAHVRSASSNFWPSDKRLELANIKSMSSNDFKDPVEWAIKSMSLSIQSQMTELGVPEHARSLSPSVPEVTEILDDKKCMSPRLTISQRLMQVSADGKRLEQVNADSEIHPGTSNREETENFKSLSLNECKNEITTQVKLDDIRSITPGLSESEQQHAENTSSISNEEEIGEGESFAEFENPLYRKSVPNLLATEPQTKPKRKSRISKSRRKKRVSCPPRPARDFFENLEKESRERVKSASTPQTDRRKSRYKWELKNKRYLWPLNSGGINALDVNYATSTSAPALQQQNLPTRKSRLNPLLKLRRQRAKSSINVLLS